MSLPPGTSARPPTLDDAAGVAALVAARDAVDFGDVHAPQAEELHGWWLPEAHRLATDRVLLVDGERVVGYGSMHRQGGVAELADESCVHPDARGRGTGTYLVSWAERWAAERSLAPVRASVVNADGRALLEGRGYGLVRHFWRMELELTEEPAPVAAPPGSELRPYRPGEDDPSLHAMREAAFREHWGFVPAPLPVWLRRRQERSDYDPALWVLATAAGELAGAALAFGEGGRGWILDLAVAERWRGRGLGLALLRAAFRELWLRGHPHVGLEVDAANATGATRLYERAGMRVTRRYDTYERSFPERSS
jgi:mycothiol synthase